MQQPKEFPAGCTSNPEKLQELEIFPTLPMFWADNQVVLAMFPVGSKYFGNVVHPPLGVGAALRQLVLPQFRGGVAGLNVINEAAALARAVQEMQSKRRKKRAR